MKKVLIPLLALALIVVAAPVARADESGSIVTIGTDVQFANLMNTFKFGFSGPGKSEIPNSALKTRQVESSPSAGILLDYKYAFKIGVFVGAEFMYNSVAGKIMLPKSVSDTHPKFDIDNYNVGPLVGYYFLMGQARPYIMAGVDVDTAKLTSGGKNLDVGRKGHLQTTSANVFLGGGCDYVAPFGLVAGGGLRFDDDIAQTFHDRARGNDKDKLTYAFNRLPLGVVAHVGYKF